MSERGCSENGKPNSRGDRAMGMEKGVPVLLFVVQSISIWVLAERRNQKGKEERNPILFSLGLDHEQQKMVWDCVQIFAISLASAVTAEGALAPPQFLINTTGACPPIPEMLTSGGGSAVVAAHLPNGELLQSAGQGREAHQEAYARSIKFIFIFI